MESKKRWRMYRFLLVAASSVRRAPREYYIFLVVVVHASAPASALPVCCAQRKKLPQAHSRGGRSTCVRAYARKRVARALPHEEAFLLLPCSCCFWPSPTTSHERACAEYTFVFIHSARMRPSQQPASHRALCASQIGRQKDRCIHREGCGAHGRVHQ